MCLDQMSNSADPQVRLKKVLFQRSLIVPMSAMKGLICSVIVLFASWMMFASPVFALDYNRESLIGRDFSGQDLTDSEFTKANMRESNLSHAYLVGVRFFATNLERANLEGADLRNSVLDSARLVRANLKDANLEGAFAANTKFEGATIDGADFTDVELRPDVQKMLCAAATGTNPTTGRETRETLYCD